MSYKLIYPYTEEERINFIVTYNHQQSLKIETVDNFIDVVDEKINYPTYYALEANEIMVDDEPVVDPEYEEKQAQKERNRIAMLSLTRGDVFRGLLQAKQVTRAQIRAMIEGNTSLDEISKEMALIDFDEALNFYRGNPLIDTIGLTLGITSEQLDEFFETGDWTCLIVPVEEQSNIEN